MEPTPPPTNNQIDFVHAPLVHLIDTDVRTLTEEQLRDYLAKVREMKGSAPTRKAATKRGADASVGNHKATGGLNLKDLM